jgi:choline dehydrogenase-like flavoprotein
LANHCLWIRPSSTDARIDDQLLLSFLGVKKVRDLSIRQIFGILRNRDIQNRVLAKCVVGFQPSYIFGDLFFLTEQLPNPRSRVELSQKQRDRFDYPIASVNWQISNADIEGFDRYLQTVLKEGLVSGQYSLVRHDPISEWTRSMSSAAHHLGTAKMGTSPRSGVVDSDLQVFGVNNLFIGDGSVFPTAGNANPSLTIVALALRLAEHLINKSQTQSTM